MSETSLESMGNARRRARRERLALAIETLKRVGPDDQSCADVLGGAGR